jgi:hypothetical protein
MILNPIQVGHDLLVGKTYDATLNSLLDSRRVQLDQTVKMLGAQSALPNLQH